MASTTTVELGPLIQYAAPVALAIVSAAITWGVRVGAVAIQKLTHHTITASQQDQVRDWANDQAGKAIAASQTNLAGQAIRVDDPLIQNTVKVAQVLIPELLAATGITPTKLADMVVGEIGRLQPLPAPPVTVIPAPVAAVIT